MTTFGSEKLHVERIELSENMFFEKLFKKLLIFLESLVKIINVADEAAVTRQNKIQKTY
ncbi:hypothetical protein [Jeotgalibacillus haloalkalitolerans]|nr:hypothetical protein [Jeotgalibacillus sp. HH7-29]